MPDRQLPTPFEAPSPADDLVTVTTCATEFEAQTKAAVLREADIDAVVFAAAHAALPLGGKFFGVPVQVRAADVDRAKAALAENKIQAASVDWDSVDIGVREDALPLHEPGRMPWLIRAGFLVAVLAIVLTLACFAYVLWP
jgi:hypothetical protein